MKQNKIEEKAKELSETIKNRCTEKGLMDKLNIRICNAPKYDSYRADTPIIKIKCSENIDFKPFYEVMSSVFEDKISQGYNLEDVCPLGDFFVFSKLKTSFLGMLSNFERIQIEVRMTEEHSRAKLIPYMDAPKDKEIELRYDNPLFLNAGRLLSRKAQILDWNARYGGRK